MLLPASKSAGLRDPLDLAQRLFNALYSRWVIATYPFTRSPKRLSIHPTCELHREVAHLMTIGDNVCLHQGAWVNIALSDGQRDPAIVIEDGCTIGRGSIVSAKNKIHFEPYVMFGPRALAMDHAHAYEDVTLPICDQGITAGGRIRIGQGCWIGHGAAIVCTQGELSLGRNCVVAANSLVTRSFPAYCVIAGNPARIIRQYDPAKKTWTMGASRASVSSTSREMQEVVTE